MAVPLGRRSDLGYRRTIVTLSDQPVRFRSSPTLEAMPGEFHNWVRHKTFHFEKTAPYKEPVAERVATWDNERSLWMISMVITTT